MAEHTPETPDASQPSDAAPAYTIGYRRPPAHTRFKPGHRGCGGRPKKQRNVRTVLKSTLEERITIREGKRTRSVSKLDAIILRLVNDAASGDAKALSNLITLMRSQGLIERPQEGTNTEPFTTDDLAIIADFLGRHGNQAEPTQPPESNEKAEAGEIEPASKQTKETKL
jgi:uncharacterized protein DUF5681